MIKVGGYNPLKQGLKQVDDDGLSGSLLSSTLECRRMKSIKTRIETEFFVPNRAILQDWLKSH